VCLFAFFLYSLCCPPLQSASITAHLEVDMQQILHTFTDRHTSALFSRQVASLNKLCRAKAAGLVRICG
jgi:hypothetical protein